MAKEIAKHKFKDPVCFAIHWGPLSESEIVFENRVFKISERVQAPEIFDLIDLKYFLKDEIQKIVFTRWSINSVLFVNPSPAASACLVKYIYSDFGQNKYQTAFYVADSVNKKVWLIR